MANEENYSDETGGSLEASSSTSVSGRHGDISGRLGDTSSVETSGKTQFLNEHLEIVAQKIRKKAGEIAHHKGREVEPRDIAQAAEMFAPGDSLPPLKPRLIVYEKLAASISGITLFSGLLALAFGVIGAVAAYRGYNEFAKDVWDIVKIFAGAVVGSAGATATIPLRRATGIE